MTIPAKRSSSPDTPAPPPKAIKPSRVETTGIQVLEIHETVCSAENDHAGHPLSAKYLDAPRLFHGDSKASNLRGENAVQNIEECLKTIDILRIKVYNCNAYHDDVKDQFAELRAPSHPMNPNIKRHFYILESDGEKAAPEGDELVIVAQDIRDQMKVDLDIQIERIVTTKRSELMKVAVDRFFAFWCRSAFFKEAIEHRMTHILQYMLTLFGHEYQEANDLFARGRVTRTHLAKLFSPREIIVDTREGQPRGYLLNGWPVWKEQTLVFPCVSWSFDGKFFRWPAELQLVWPLGKEEVAVTALGVYPLRIDEGMKSRLLERGNAFWKYRTRRLVCLSPVPPVPGTPTFNIRYMIDAAAHLQIRSQTSNTANTSYDYLPIDKHNAEAPPDEQFLLILPTSIPAFSLLNRIWVSALIGDIYEIEWNAEPFNCLMLKSTKKDLIRALVAKLPTTTNQNPLVVVKGSGLVLLLHGGPGTGKALTAESIAELTRKPLHRLSCRNLGTTVQEVEGAFRSILNRGAFWHSVVLLEEADVFLEKRTQQDPQSNALLLAFINLLDYYPGILILKATKTGTLNLNEAFRSQIQLTIHYPPLGEGGRRQIWASMLRSVALDVRVDQFLDELASFKLNGHEIRHSARLAKLLAVSRGQPIQPSHFLEVIALSNELPRRLEDTHGHSVTE